MSGEVVHFELCVDDIERAQAFYQEAFGWRTNAVPEMNYVLVSTTKTDKHGRPSEPGAINGGMMVRQAPFAAPIITIQVDDVDAALAKVESLGGAVVAGRQSVGDMGFSAYFTDTEGNIVGLWQNG